MKSTWRRATTLAAAALWLICLVWAVDGRAQERCPGDCNGDGRIDIAELIKGVGVLLGQRPLGDCVAIDCSDRTTGLSCMMLAIDGAMRDRCEPPREVCGLVLCPVGQVCCNPLGNVCASPEDSCIQ